MAELLFYYLLIGMVFNIVLIYEYIRDFISPRHRVKVNDILAIFVGGILVTTLWPLWLVQMVTRDKDYYL